MRAFTYAALAAAALGSIAELTHAASQSKGASVLEPPPIVRTNVAPPPIIQVRDPIATALDNATLQIHGALTQGSAAQFARILKQHPQARTVVLDSAGGSIGEALDIADMIREARLNTYVERSCLSACTLILLAGTDRAASPNARIGFHRPTFVGATSGDLPTLNSVARSLYDEAGVAPTFTDRTFDTSPSDMWYPTNSELFVAHVLTRISLGGETRAAVSSFRSKDWLAAELTKLPYWAALNRNRPTIAAEVLDVIWKSKEAGGTDADVTNAARAALMKRLPEIFATAPDDTLLDYLDLVAAQLEAARAISFEACDLALNGKLNPMATLPRAMVEKELSILTKAIESAPVKAHPNEEAALKILEPYYATLPADQLLAMAGEAGFHSTSARCNGTLSFYRSLAKADSQSKAIVARWMFGTNE